MNDSFRSVRRRLLVATAVLGAVLALAAAAGAAPTKNAWQLDGRAGAEIVSGLQYYDRGALVVIPSRRSGPDVEGATTITGDDLPAPVDFIGGMITSGDVDGDGYGDLITSGRDYSSASAGQMVLVVIPGGANGATAENAYIVTDNGPGIGGRVLAGDLDRDGIADVVAQSGDRNAPEVTILWGGERGLTTDRATKIAAPQQRRFGELMAVGDVDGNRVRDLVLAQGGRLPDNESTKRVRGFLTVCRIQARDAVRCKAPMRISSGAYSIAMGDFIGGNGEEVVIGVPVTNRRDDTVNRPALWMYRGTDSGLVGPPVKLVRGSRGIPGTHTQHSAWGSALAAADVDRNGKDELVVGAPNEKRGGRVTVLYGARRGPGSTNRDLTISQASTGIAGRNERGDGFGGGVSLLDVTGDGLLDLLVGSPGEDDRLGGITVIPSGEGRFSTRRSVRIEADELGLDPERGEVSLGWVLGQ